VNEFQALLKLSYNFYMHGTKVGMKASEHLYRANSITELTNFKSKRLRKLRKSKK